MANDLRSVITESMRVHSTRRFWSYSGVEWEHDETHENGVVCMCRWAHVSNEAGVCGPAYEVHRADMLAAALVDAGFVVDDALALSSGGSREPKVNAREESKIESCEVHRYSWRPGGCCPRCPVPSGEVETPPNQWAGQSTLLGRMWHHWNADLKRRMAGEVETPCATCWDENCQASLGRVRRETHDYDTSAKWMPCPDCGVETPEAEWEGEAESRAALARGEGQVFASADGAIRASVKTPSGWAEFFAERKQAGMGSFWLPPEIAREMPLGFICGMVCTCGPNLEPLACGYKHGHDGEHAWASLPTFATGEVETPCATCGGVELDEWHSCSTCGRSGEVETACARPNCDDGVLHVPQGAGWTDVPCPDCGVETPEAAVEAGARAHHEAYEARSALIGYETRTVTRVSWDDLSAEMKDLMLHAERAALKAALPHLSQGWTPPGGTE